MDIRIDQCLHVEFLVIATERKGSPPLNIRYTVQEIHVYLCGPRYHYP